MVKILFKIDGYRPVSNTRRAQSALYVVRWYQENYYYRIDGPAGVWLYGDGGKEYFHYGD
jgi:hypothetical protein